MSTHGEIESAVRAELMADPRLPHPGEVAIEVDAGVVTLRGTVGSFAQLRAAVASATSSTVGTTITKAPASVACCATQSVVTRTSGNVAAMSNPSPI